MKKPQDLIGILLDKGFTALRQNDLNAAIDSFESALNVCANNDRAYQGLGFAYLEQKKYALALEYFQKALIINTNNAETHLGLGMLYNRGFCSGKDTDDAIVELKKAIAIKSSLIEAFTELGFIYIEKNELALAELEFNRAAEIESSNVYIYLGRAKIALKNRQYAEAQRLLQIAKKADPANMHIRDELIILQQTQGMHDLAVDEIITISEENNKNKHLQDAKPSCNASITDRIKIIRTLSLWDSDAKAFNFSILPPLALGLITSRLRHEGYVVDQDDLNIKIHRGHMFNANECIDLRLFLDEARVLSYINGKKDDHLKNTLLAISEKTKLSGYKIILLSIPESIRNPSNLLFILGFSKLLKELYNPIIIVGGMRWALDLLRTKYSTKYIDYIVLEKGEEASVKLLNAICQGVSVSKDSDLMIIDEKTVMAETYDLAEPDFYGLEMDLYRYANIKNAYNHNYANYNKLKDIIQKFITSKILIIPVKFIKGCPHSCVFCAESHNRRLYVMKPQRASDILNQLKIAHNPDGFFFLSDTINISKKYINELCDNIISKNIKVHWSDCARADNLDKETVFKMQKAGCIRLIYGIETGSRRLLRFINKNINLDNLERVLRWTDEAGIWCGIEIICGLPHEREEDINETIAFLKRNKRYIDRIYCNVFDLRDGSLLLKEPQSYGIENIKEFNIYATRNEDSFNRGNFVRYGFDEKDGLKWEEKKKQIIASFKKVTEALECNVYIPFFEEEHFLFYLYSIFTDKKKIRTIFNEFNVILHPQFNLRRKENIYDEICKI